MSDMLIRNVSERVRERLKREAAKRGRSVQAEANDVLEDWLERKEREDRDWWDKVDALRRRIGPVPGNSADLIREDRDTDHGRDQSGYRT